MTVDHLPLLDLFSRLQDEGLPLGVDDYQLLLRALQAGFGLPGRDELEQLCSMLWVKSAYEKELFKYHFDIVIATPPQREFETSRKPESVPIVSPVHPVSSPETNHQSQVSPEDTISPDNNHLSTPPPLTFPNQFPQSNDRASSEDNLQLIHPIPKAVRGGDGSHYNRLISADSYSPVTGRQMKQSWRYLRRMVRRGPLTELDIEATINKIGRQGVLLEPVLVPRRTNQVELLLLSDRGGSMVPFHPLSRRLEETALRGGRLGNISIYHFHNCPTEYFFQNILSHPRHRKTLVLIFSDAGAARGNLRPERVEMTKVFLDQLCQHVHSVAWLNPMPSEYWHSTTADTISEFVPMFEISRRGLDDAIAVLRGRSVHLR